ncbi:protein of unknown function UPF0126 [Thioalkalivibrio sp. K90mix]|uniref:TRIC cation channel family protein n=1 Tax=Thioalkalivibrio sp. (strain K90mix) TaxID=396595 RepID=UPI000195A539|nr:TRIC cation channel family protein [Thioalkalivibrio sp. K90mix]ADC72079.1 protein of unknown function UPF0126 [Thioalkalivibrio sp. K90mix]
MGLALAILAPFTAGASSPPSAADIGTPIPIAQQSAPETLRSGWFERPPYQAGSDSASRASPAGLDVRVAQEALAGVGRGAEFTPLSWNDQLAALRHGAIDFVIGTYFDSGRLDYAHYSQPYRQERNALYVRAGEHGDYSFQDRAALVQAVRDGEFRLGVTTGYAYASSELADLVADPGEAARLYPAAGDEAHIQALIKGRIDGFVADPVIVDLLLARTDRARAIQTHPLDLGTVGVRVMFSRATVPAAFVEQFNAQLQALEDSRRMAALEVEHVLPAFLSMATSEAWFNTLTLLGILAFSASGLILARRERYNLFGALVLASLPAIGGGVLRDLLLGRDPIFIFETPEFLLVPIVVVGVGFVLYKLHDHVLVRWHVVQELLTRQQAGLGGRVVGNLQRGLDAWAVASFTVIGVGVAVESQASPLWLWGPVMAVVTASFGVIMRDVVRSDFNIDMLKRDSFAEISVLGGILYSLILLWPPVELSLGFILITTHAVIVLLFLARLGVLYWGRPNPLQMGDPHTLPERRLEALARREPEAWSSLTGYLTEDDEGRARPVDPGELERLHKDFEYLLQPVFAELGRLAGEPLLEAAARRHEALRDRFRLVARLEQQMYDHLRATVTDMETAADEVARALEGRVLEALRGLLDAATMAVYSRDREDLAWLRDMTANQRSRFDALRARYLDPDHFQPGGALDRVLQRTHRVERMLWMLAEYADRRLEPTVSPVQGDRRALQRRFLRAG